MKDLAVVLGTETATIILDDTISVWPEHQHNLMQAGLSPYLAGRFQHHMHHMSSTHGL